MVAEHNVVSDDAAFELIRGFARSHNRLLSDTARQTVDGTLSPEQLGLERASNIHAPLPERAFSGVVGFGGKVRVTERPCVRGTVSCSEPR